MRREEDALQIAILQYLAAVLPDALVFHVPNAAKRSLQEGARFKRLGVRAGVADLVLVVAGNAFFIEVKASKGRLTDAQHRFGEDARIAGAGWCCVRTVDEVRAALKAWEIPTRETGGK